MKNTVELIGYYGGDIEHALSAWTSTSRDLTPEKIERIPNLLNMLASNGHETPFEKSSLHFLVTSEFAKLLDGCQYGEEITDGQIKLAKENNLVVVTGYSDDNILYQGSINDESGHYGGGNDYIFNNDLVSLAREFDDIEDQVKFLKKYGVKFHKITSVWCDPDLKGTDKECSFTFKTDIPHSTFRIFEDKELYCIGIVFSLDELGEAQ